MPASISGVTLNDSFFYVNQLGDYNTFTANGHSTVAVVGTYLSHFIPVSPRTILPSIQVRNTLSRMKEANMDRITILQ